MPNFTVTLTQAQEDRLKAVAPDATAADWQGWLKRQLKTEVVKRELRKAEAALKDTSTIRAAQIESDLTAEGWI